MDKQEIINNKNELINFLENDNNSKILELLNQEGLELLKKSKLKEDKIKLILSYSKYKNELLQNIDFLDILLTSNINKFYTVLKDLDNKTYEIIFNRCIELNIDENILARLFTFFSDEFKLQVIENKTLNLSFIINILNKSHNTKIVQKIIEKYDIDFRDEKVNIISLFEKGKKAFLKNSITKLNELITIHPNLITKTLAERLWNECDIFKLRKVLNDAQYSTDIEVLNQYVKSQEDQIIKEKTNQSLVYPYNEIYDSYKIYKEQEYNFNNDKLNYSEHLYYEMKNKFELLCKQYNIKKSDIELKMNTITSEIKNNNIEEVFDYLKLMSNKIISNYIIDYHFEENYHNIFLDVTELLQYNYDGNITIPKERLEIYEKIINIDYLSLEEKQKLHETLKQYNMIEMFYDDMRFARDVVAETIKDYSLSKESIQQFKDKKLSKQYGVDVYNMNGKPFFGIIKTGRKISNAFPVGHSFSLIGTNGLAVFGNKTYGETYLYDSTDVTKEQIIHVFPYDSYTRYKPFELTWEPSMRVNTLMTPQKLTTHSNSYNEILILEHGEEETYMDEYIPRLKQIALYCIDEITSQDIELARQNNVGIILIDSSKYQQIGNEQNTINNFEQNKYNYFDGISEKEYYEERRR